MDQGLEVANADAGVNELKDVKGKGFATQVRGNTGELIARHVLRVGGYTYSDVKASFTNSYSDSIEQMKDNRMHVFALGTAIPASSVMDLAAARDIKVIDLSSIYEPMRKINPAYKLVTIPKGTYPKQDKDVQTIGYFTHIIAACSLPEDTVYKMTGAAAAALGLHDRGLLRRGAWADITVFDPDRIADRATYENPHQYAVGISTVVVNGEVVIDGGDHTGARPGRVLRRPSSV